MDRPVGRPVKGRRLVSPHRLLFSRPEVTVSNPRVTTTRYRDSGRVLSVVRRGPGQRQGHFIYHCQRRSISRTLLSNFIIRFSVVNFTTDRVSPVSRKQHQ